MLQSAQFDGVSFDPFSVQQDGLASPEVDVGRGQVADAFVISAVIVMFDECRDLRFEVVGEEVVFEQDAVLERLVPALDLSLRLRMAGSAVDLFDGTLFEPFAKVRGDVTGAVAPTEGREGAAETTVRAAFGCRRAPVEVAMASQGFSRM